MGNLVSSHVTNDPITTNVGVQPKTATGLDNFVDVPACGLLAHAAASLPGRSAIVYGDRSWTYAELNDDVIRAAAMLQQLGIQPGDRVGILLPNVPEYVIAANAIWRVGAIGVAISPLMVASEITELLKKTGCKTVVCLDMLSQQVTDSDIRLLMVSIREHLPSMMQVGYLWERHRRTGYWTLPTTDRCRWFWNEINSTADTYKPVSFDPATTPAYILPTGGTTGSPKAVVLSHTNLVANAWQQSVWTNRTFGEQSMLAVLPFFHSYGMSATVLGGASMGATLILHHRFHTQQVIRLLEKHQPTVFHAVPAMLVAMNERFRKRRPSIDHLRWVISGGAPLEATIAQEFASFTGAHVVEGYGLSEASPVTHVGHLFREPVYNTIGYPLPYTRCRIADPDDLQCELNTGEVGELLVQGPQIMLGYWNDEEATSQAIQDGWLLTGDFAMRERSGRYRIVGRRKDLVITSGFNVYPSEVEEVLRQSPMVTDAAVIGVPDPQRGEIVKAFVVLSKGTVFDEDALREYCKQHLSKYKRPRVYERCVDDLPRNFLGKVIRRELRKEGA